MANITCVSSVHNVVLRNIFKIFGLKQNCVIIKLLKFLTYLFHIGLSVRISRMTNHWPQENWMSQLPDNARSRPLTELVIPGSHDSFAYNLETSLGYAPDLADTGVADIVETLSKALPSIRLVVHNWSKTQQLSFADQLKSGIRFFDIRVGYHLPTEKMRFLHGLWGGDVFDEIGKTERATRIK